MPFDLHKEIHDSDDFYFLSYKKEDVDVLRTIVPHFRFDAWYDFAISYAEAWTESIASHLLNSKAVIMFLSKELLRPGTKSFPYLEYRLAEKHNKDILVVYLDEIQNDDIPISLKFWIPELDNNRCIFYDRSQPVEMLVEEIHNALEDIARYHNKSAGIHAPAPAAVRPMDIKCFSSFNDDAYLYVGNGEIHLSADGRKLCLYNTAKKQYEVRIVDDMNILYAAIKSKTDLSDYTIFYTNDGKYCYYIKGDHIFTYDIHREKWLSPLGVKLPLGRHEIPASLAQQAVGDTVYLTAVQDKEISTLLRFNVAQNKVEGSWNLKPYHFNNHIDYLQDIDINTIVFTDTANRVSMLGLNDLRFFAPDPDLIAAYYSRQPHLTDDPNILLSHDGLIYSVPTAKSFRVLDTATGNLLHEEYKGTFRNVFLLRNRIVLKYDLSGTVTSISPTAKQKLFEADYYRNTPAFGGSIPHTMHFDEAAGQFIYVMYAGAPKNNIHRVVVTDIRGNVTQVSNDFKTPLDTENCMCKIVNGRLFVTFLAEGGKKYKKLQNTFIFSAEYP